MCPAANNVGAMFKQMSAYFALANVSLLAVPCTAQAWCPGELTSLAYMQVGLPGVALHFKVSATAILPTKHGRGCTLQQLS